MEEGVGSDRTQPTIAGTEDEGGAESRNVGSLQKLEKARKWVLPRSLQKGTQPW